MKIILFLILIGLHLFRNVQHKKTKVNKKQNYFNQTNTDMMNNTPPTAPEKTLQEMTFQEYWDFLKDFDFQEYKEFKKSICILLGIQDSELRRRVRKTTNVSNAEKLVIASWISDRENNPAITTETLFS